MRQKFDPDKWPVPIPANAAFRLKVRREIRQADFGAKILMRDFVKSQTTCVRSSKRNRTYTRKPIVRNVQFKTGNCANCGCVYNDYTIGCRTCAKRHSVRRQLVVENS